MCVCMLCFVMLFITVFFASYVLFPLSNCFLLLFLHMCLVIWVFSPMFRYSCLDACICIYVYATLMFSLFGVFFGLLYCVFRGSSQHYHSCPFAVLCFLCSVRVFACLLLITCRSFRNMLICCSVAP